MRGAVTCAMRRLIEVQAYQVRLSWLCNSSASTDCSLVIFATALADAYKAEYLCVCTML